MRSYVWLIIGFIINFKLNGAKNISMVKRSPPPPVCSLKYTYFNGGDGILEPDEWGHRWRLCNGEEQSPIDIREASTEHHGMHRLVSSNYYREPSGDFMLVNNGHSLELQLPKDNMFDILKGDVHYQPVSMHLHFAHVEEDIGSEHSIHGHFSVAELHLVHKPRGIFHHGRVLVIAVMVELDKHEVSHVIKAMAKNAHTVKYPRDEVTFPIKAFPLNLVVPTDMKGEYVNYRGSYTTPPCTQNVDWVVFLNPHLKITRGALEDLMEAESCFSKHLAGNRRPIQHLNERDVIKEKQ